jgi:hypothetical protein
MAYSLGDFYRPLRITLRINGLLLGLGVGSLLLIFPRSVLQHWYPLAATDPTWLARCAGALLIAVGCLFLLASGEEMIATPILITATVAHGLVSVVLLTAYVQREFSGLSVLGSLVLVAIFLLCLAGAVMPLRYLRTDYQRF